MSVVVFRLILTMIFVLNSVGNMGVAAELFQPAPAKELRKLQLQDRAKALGIPVSTTACLLSELDSQNIPHYFEDELLNAFFDSPGSVPTMEEVIARAKKISTSSNAELEIESSLLALRESLDNIADIIYSNETLIVAELRNSQKSSPLLMNALTRYEEKLRDYFTLVWAHDLHYMISDLDIKNWQTLEDLELIKQVEAKMMLDQAPSGGNAPADVAIKMIPSVLIMAAASAKIGEAGVHYLFPILGLFFTHVALGAFHHSKCLKEFEQKKLELNNLKNSKKKPFRYSERAMRELEKVVVEANNRSKRLYGFAVMSAEKVAQVADLKRIDWTAKCDLVMDVIKRAGK